MVLFRTLRSSFATVFKTGPRSSKYGERYSLDSLWLVTQSLPFVGEGMRDEPLRTSAEEATQLDAFNKLSGG